MELTEPISSMQYDDVLMGTDSDLYGFIESLAPMAQAQVASPSRTPAPFSYKQHPHTDDVHALAFSQGVTYRPPCFVTLQGLHHPARPGTPVPNDLDCCAQEDPARDCGAGQNGAGAARPYQNTPPDVPLFPPAPAAMPPLPTIQWPPADAGGGAGLLHESSSRGNSMGAAADRAAEGDAGKGRAGRPRAMRRRGSGGSGDEEARHLGSPIHKTESDRDKNKCGTPIRVDCGHAAERGSHVLNKLW